MFVHASEILVNAADVANNRGRLSGELVHVQGLATALASDLTAAEAGLTATNDERKAAELRIAANQAKLDAVQHKMAEEQMELTAGKILGTVAAVAGAIVAVAGAVYSGGSSVAAAAACIGLLVDIHGATEQSGSKDNIIDDFKNNSSGWVDWNAEGGPKLTKEADKFVGGLEDLVKKSKDFYDKFQTAKELFEAKVDGELQNQEKELLTERIELTMARNIVELKTLQGGFQVSAAKQRKATAEADIQNLKEQAQTLGASIAFLANTTRILVRHAQGYAEYMTKYRLYTATAKEL
jgi:hypothetical protein